MAEEETPLLMTLEDIFLSQLSDNNMDEATVEQFYCLFEAVKPELVKSTMASYRALAPSMLEEDRIALKGFEARSFARWKTAFDLLETMHYLARELGEANAKELAISGEVDLHEADLVAVALGELFPKALLIVGEIICLLKGGYPDGALARWRSLHEVTVTAMYLRKHGRSNYGGNVALAYLMSFDFAARRAIRELDSPNLAERAGIEPPSEDELAELDVRCEKAERMLGRKIESDSDGEWPAINPRGHSDFAAIEKDVKMDRWRPRYKWASIHVHATYRPHTNLLGTIEAKSGVHLVGPSNVGFIDPFQMTAITLTQVTVTYLLHKLNPDRIVHAEVMSRLLDEMLEFARATVEASEDICEWGPS